MSIDSPALIANIREFLERGVDVGTMSVALQVNGSFHGKLLISRTYVGSARLTQTHTRLFAKDIDDYEDYFGVIDVIESVTPDSRIVLHEVYDATLQLESLVRGYHFFHTAPGHVMYNSMWKVL